MIGQESDALAAGGLSGQAMPLPDWERGSFQGRCTHLSGRAALARRTPVPVLGYGLQDANFLSRWWRKPGAAVILP